MHPENIEQLLEDMGIKQTNETYPWHMTKSSDDDMIYFWCGRTLALGLLVNGETAEDIINKPQGYAWCTRCLVLRRNASLGRNV